MIYGMGLCTSARCMVVPCCDQDGYQAQVQQNPIDSYRYISHSKFKLNNIKSLTIFIAFKVSVVSSPNYNHPAQR